MATTLAADYLFNPVVWKDHIQAYFDSLLVWGQSASRFDDLTQSPGETLTWPFFKSIGAAEKPAEAAALTPDKLGDDSFTSSVLEVGKAIEFSDKSFMVSGARQEMILAEAQRQIARVMAEQVDADIVTEVYTPANRVEAFLGTGGGDTMTLSRLFGAKIDGFGERHLEGAVAYMHSKQFKDLVQDTGTGLLKADATDAFARVNGFVGRLAGLGIVVSDQCPKTTDGIAVGVDSYEAIILKPNSHGLIVKKDFGMFESDRDILARTTVASMTSWYSVKSFHAKVNAADLRAATVKTA